MAKQAKRDVLISIRPQYVKTILNRTKRYEFRTVAPDIGNIGDVYIYASAPVQRIVASFTASEVIIGPPRSVWERCHEHAGETSEDFFGYFAGHDRANAIVLDYLRKASRPVNPFAIFERFRPPQSYMYVPWDRCKISRDAFASRFA